jgi:hypothetical protein
MKHVDGQTKHPYMLLFRTNDDDDVDDNNDIKLKITKAIIRRK